MKILRPLLLCALLAGRVAGQTPEQMFQKGNGLYQEAKYPEARDAYETVLHNGYASGELYYNLGNAYYKMGNVALAILNYERAARLMPGDEDLQHNLQLANLMIVDRIEPVPRLFLWDYWDAVKNALSLNALAWTTYAVFLLIIAFLVLVALTRSYALRKVGFLGAVTSGVVLLALIGTLAVRMSDARRTDEAIITASFAPVKNSPDTKSSDAFVLHAGVKVWMTDRVTEWIKIRLADGKVGWVEQNQVEVI